MPRPVAGFVAATQPPLADPELEEAAAIFLRGSLCSGRMGVASEIAGKAVAQVALALSECSPTSIREIRKAVVVFRREQSLWSREGVIEAVTCAAAQPRLTRRENR